MSARTDPPLKPLVSQAPVGRSIPFARISLGLGLAFIVLQAIKRLAPDWAGLYVAALIMGLIIYQRSGVNAFLASVRSRL